MDNKKALYVSTGDIIMQRDMLILNTVSSKIRITVMMRTHVERRDSSQSKDFRILAPPSKNKIIFVWKVFMHLFLNGYEIVLFSSPILFPIVTLAAKARHFKILYDYHAFPIANLQAWFKQRLRINCLASIARIIATKLENIFLRFCDGIIATPLIDKEAERLFRCNKNIEVISNYPSVAVTQRSTRLFKRIENSFIIYSA